MKEQKDNSKLIFALSMLWGFSLIFAQFSYFLGSTEGTTAAIDAMTSYLPTSIAIIMMSWIVGKNLSKINLNIQFTKRKFIVTAILCLFFFPIGLIFLFGKLKYSELKS